MLAFEVATRADDRRPSIPATIATVVLGYHLQAFPHELVHVGTCLATGGRFNQFIFTPFFQAVDLTYGDAAASAPRWAGFATNLSAQVFSRFTGDLPRWIYSPSEEGFYFRLTSAYAWWSRATLLSTMAMAIVGQAAGTSGPIGDFDNAARNLSDQRFGQLAFLTGVAGLLAFDFIWNWDSFWLEQKAMLGLISFDEWKEKRLAPREERKVALLISSVFAGVRVKF